LELKHYGSVASGIQIDRSSRLHATSGIDARGTRNDDREGCGACGMRSATSSRSAHAGTERASVLKRLKGALAALAGGAALDPLCARRSDAIAGDGRRRNANRALGCEVLNARSPAIGTVVLARLAVCAAVFTAVSLPSQSALAAYPWSASPKSEIFERSGNLNPIILPTHAAITAAVRRRSSSRYPAARLEQPWTLRISISTRALFHLQHHALRSCNVSTDGRDTGAAPWKLQPAMRGRSCRRRFQCLHRNCAHIVSLTY